MTTWRVSSQSVRSLKGFGAFEAAQPPAAATAFEDQAR
jgi:hypothetical protein